MVATIIRCMVDTASYRSVVDYYLGRIMQYFDSRTIPVTIFRVDRGSDLSYIRRLMSTTQNSNTSDTTNIILCDTLEALRLLKEVNNNIN